MIDMPTSTLRPGLLISLKTSVVGNVSYSKQIIEADHTTEEGTRRAQWNTTREIVDPTEHNRAIKARGQARQKIRQVAAPTAFGLLCPETKEAELKVAVMEARQIADEFNRRAKFTRLEVYVFCGRVAPDDVEAVRAINSEVRDLLNEMEQGLKNLDVKRVRQAAMEARSIGKMLTPQAEARIKQAIDAARSVARQIVKAGDQVAMEIDRTTIKKLAEARTSFLDLDTFEQVGRPAESGRALDLIPESKTPAKKSRDKARALDL